MNLSYEHLRTKDANESMKCDFLVCFTALLPCQRMRIQTMCYSRVKSFETLDMKSKKTHQKFEILIESFARHTFHGRCEGRGAWGAIRTNSAEQQKCGTLFPVIIHVKYQKNDLNCECNSTPVDN